MTCSQVTVTAPTASEAESLGEMALTRRLAACVQVSGPISSAYWWDGKVTTAEEWVCTLKTTTALVEDLTRALKEAHSYDVPEVVAVPIESGDPDYLAWIEAETSGPRG
jgi:periplasmic divalent cation tolerance protein